MKTNAIIRIILFSLAILALVSILLGFHSFEMYINDGKVRIDHSLTPEALEQLQTKNISADIRNIEIEWAAGSITFQKDPHATSITVHEFSPVESDHIMVLKQSGQTLKIQFSEKDFGLIGLGGINVDVSKDLVITVPAEWTCNSLEIDTAAAEVIMNDLTIREFDLDGASGECRMTNCDIGELDINTASGNVHFSGTLETLDCDAASADCTIEATNIPRSIELDGMSGELELILPPDAGFICKLDTLSGSFDTDFEFSKHDDTYICGNGECKINVKAMSSNVSILQGIA